LQLRLVCLGSSSAVPTRIRGLSSTALLYGNKTLIFDCGEGTQRALLRAGIGFSGDTSIFVTHMHGDHVVGILGILQTMSMYRRTLPCKVYGPEDLKEFIESAIRTLKFGLTYNIQFTKVEPGKVVLESNFEVWACKSFHSVESFAYRFKERRRPGVFNVNKAKALGIPEGELWSKLQHGKTVRVGGRKFRPSEVLGLPRPGRSVGISGDTRPSPQLTRFFRGMDVLFFDSTYGEKHKENAKENFHSTASEAAELAEQAGVDLLVLTHFSARYSRVMTLLKEARKIHKNTIAARDQMVIEVPFREKGRPRELTIR
jgi:ribonuclease Z